MARAKNPRQHPATTPEARESQMVSLAVSLAEKQLREGTAPASVITHYLKLGTTREALEQERLRRENLVLEAKASSIASSMRSEEQLEAAIQAFSSYRSDSDPVD